MPLWPYFHNAFRKKKKLQKKTDLAGSFVRYIDDKPARRGNMVVRDLSSTGLKLEVNGKLNFSPGDVLEIQFRLDDSKNTLIKTKVVIRVIENLYIGAEFFQNETEVNGLGFYLMP